MKRIILFLIVTGAARSCAQMLSPEVFASSGGYSSNTGGTVSWTLGEPVSETQSNQYILTEGFNQPAHIYVTSVPSESAGGIFAYPNPVQNDLVMDFRGMKAGTYSVTLYDELGKLLHAVVIIMGGLPVREKIDLTEYVEGLYLVRIDCSTTQQSKLFKITKQK